MKRFKGTPDDDPSRDMSAEKTSWGWKRGPGAESCNLGGLGRGRGPKREANLDPTSHRATLPTIRPAVWDFLPLLNRTPFRTQVVLVPIVRPATPLQYIPQMGSRSEGGEVQMILFSRKSSMPCWVNSRRAFRGSGGGDLRRLSARRVNLQGSTESEST